MQVPIEYFSLQFPPPTPDSPMMYLVLQQDPKIANVSSISKGELLLHAVTKLSLWCFIGVGLLLSPEGYAQSTLKSGSINRCTEGKNDVR